MPMLKRPIEPSSITRATEGSIPPTIKNELEYVANSTQANLIRQLSSLSQHAEDMFRELFEDATAIFDRTCRLTQRVDTLKESVQQFDPNQVVVKLTDITKKKPFKTEYHTDQQICTKSTMPRSLQQMYSLCAPPPSLQKFDRFRTDGKSSVKMYTNPDYFVQLWVESIQKNVSETTKKHDGRKIKKRPSKRENKKALHNVQSKAEKYKAMAQGKEFVPAKTPAQIAAEKEAEMQRQEQEQVMRKQSVGEANGQVGGSQRQSQPSMPHQPPAPPVPTVQGGKADGYQEMIYDYGVNKPDQQVPAQNQANRLDSHHMSRVSQSPSLTRMSVPPPPPPPQQPGPFSNGLPPPPSPPGHPDIGIVPPPPSTMIQHDISSIRPASPPPPEPQSLFLPQVVPPPPPPAPMSPKAGSNAPGGPPPPPPPPPPPGPGLPPPPPPPAAPSAMVGAHPGTNAAALTVAAAGLRSAANIPKPEPVKDERSALLNQIREGMQLKRANEHKQSQSTNTLDSKKVMLGGTFDVQSIMDRVQEMRRVMENSDSDSDSESTWDDSD